MKDVSLKSIVKTTLHAGALIGAGAVVGACLRNQDLSSLKGIGKLCAGLGIVGLSHAAGSAAAQAIDNDVENVCDFVKTVTSDLDDETETDNNVVEFAAT